jgi:5-formyltetrahydrofolate cyclo-ligase
VELTATALEEKGVPLKKAATMRGALIYGKLVSFAEMQPVDLVVVGCVAASPNGGRTGKGAGLGQHSTGSASKYSYTSRAKT